MVSWDATLKKEENNHKRLNYSHEWIVMSHLKKHVADQFE